ncbi:ribonuclease [Micrococcales bacterium 31B]|nr:ribonuclease [Micrococcales bacterium 31B]
MYLFNLFSGSGETSREAGSQGSTTSSASSSLRSASATSGSTAARESARGSASPSTGASETPGDGVYTGPNPSDLPEIAESDLPAEGRETLDLIRAGGPFPYDRDGIRFGNFEGILPDETSDFYKEYTVETPGADTRGTKRIVAGETGVKYYTDDHYESFSFIVEGK